MSYIGSTPTTQSFIAGTDSFNGTGSATNFTLSRFVNSVNDVQVVVNNVVQYPPNYSVSGTTLTISPAPSAGTNNVYVRYLSTTLQSIAPSQGSSIQFGTGSAALPSISFIGDTNTGIFSPAADTIAFAEGGVEAMRIDSAGNVGIGTSSPAVKFQVQSGGTNNAVFLRGADPATNTAAAFIQCPVTSGFATSQVYGFWYQNTGLSNPANETLGFVTNNTERARIDSSGNLLVGQTAQTSSEKFGVTQSSTSASSARFYASSTSYTNDVVQISCARSGATTEYNALTVFDNNTTLKMLIRANGNLLNANNSYGSLSDQRLKENIIDATPKLEKLNQVRVVNFNMIGDEQKQIGVVAQELEQIFPAMIEEGSDGMKGVKYSVFVPILVKAIQEQQQMIETLQAKVAALEAK